MISSLRQLTSSIVFLMAVKRRWPSGDTPALRAATSRFFDFICSSARFLRRWTLREMGGCGEAVLFSFFTLNKSRAYTFFFGVWKIRYFSREIIIPFFCFSHEISRNLVTESDNSLIPLQRSSHKKTDFMLALIKKKRVKGIKKKFLNIVSLTSWKLLHTYSAGCK